MKHLFGDYRSGELLNLKKALRSIDRKCKVLDVGCGYGRKIEFLNSLDFNNITGVEINNDSVESCIKKGYNVYHTSSFDDQKSEYDLILMSHIVEHFQYDDLLEFLFKYLNFLKKGGHLIIITPTPDASFYTNFDHIKPYLPESFVPIFCPDNFQVQISSSLNLELKDIYFRRTCYRLKYIKSYYIDKPDYFSKFINKIYKFLFFITFGYFGKCNGWLGLYLKH